MFRLSRSLTAKRWYSWHVWAIGAVFRFCTGIRVPTTPISHKKEMLAWFRIQIWRYVLFIFYQPVISGSLYLTPVFASFPGKWYRNQKRGKRSVSWALRQKLFLLYQTKINDGEKNLFAIYTKILTKVPVCACRKKKCADGYFFFRFSNLCS